jgi:hypothetical protein
LKRDAGRSDEKVRMKGEAKSWAIEGKKGEKGNEKEKRQRGRP